MFLLMTDNFEYLGGAAGLPLPPLDVSQEWLRVPFYYAMLFIAIGAVWTSYRVAALEVRHGSAGDLRR